MLLKQVKCWSFFMNIHELGKYMYLYFLFFPNPSLDLFLEILQQLGHFIHFGCGCPQFSFGLPT